MLSVELSEAINRISALLGCIILYENAVLIVTNCVATVMLNTTVINPINTTLLLNFKPSHSLYDSIDRMDYVIYKYVENCGDEVDYFLI